jgi:hypothetical protein
MIHPRCCAEGIESVNVPRAEGEFENDLMPRRGETAGAAEDQRRKGPKSGRVRRSPSHAKTIQVLAHR